MRLTAPNGPSRLRLATAAATVALAAATCAPQSAGAQEICWDYDTGEEIDCPPEACVASGSDWRPWGLWPTPWTPENPGFHLPPACINQPYRQWIRIDTGGTWDFQGFSIPVSNFSLPTSDGIKGLPAGLSYTCDPPNCVFNAHTTYCVLLQGTPTASNSVGDTLDMVIEGSLSTPLGIPLPIDVPGELRPGAHYYIPIQAAGTCPTTTTSTSSTTSTSTTSTSTTSSTVLGATTTNPAASSTTTTNPAGSSTTLADPAGPSTTTSTTLPDGCSGTPYAAIACQLDALARTIDAAQDLGRLAPSFAADVASARARARGSATSCGKGKSGPARKQLRRVAATLAKIGRKLRSRAARNVSEATRNAITTPAADLGTSVKGLAARLACPDDAT